MILVSTDNTILLEQSMLVWQEMPLQITERKYPAARHPLAVFLGLQAQLNLAVDGPAHALHAKEDESQSKDVDIISRGSEIAIPF